MIETLRQDVRFGLRSLRKSASFTVAAVLTLGLGIGANAVMLSLVRGLLWRPPAVDRPEQLAVVFAQNRADGEYGDFSYADYLDFQRAGGVFTDLIAYYPVALSLARGGDAQRSWGEMVSGNYFAVLGVQPSLGRALTPEDDAPGAAGAVVLSHQLWVASFGSDPGVLGSIVRLSGHDFTVVGVAPESFAGVYFTGFRPDLWVPAHALERISGVGAQLGERGSNTFRLMGRLRPGATVAEAQAVLGAVAARLEKDHPVTNAGLQAAVFSERDSRPEPDSASDASVMAAAFLVGVGLVLLVACANVASLLLARGTTRRAEIVVRLALGADRRRLLRQLLTESVLLSAGGGVVGLLGAWWATNAMSAGLRVPTDIPFSFDLRLDLASVLVSLGACVGAAVVSGLVPALRSTSREGLRSASGEGTSARTTSRSRLRQALVVGQVSISCVLLVAAGLALRSLKAMEQVAPGFETRGGLLVSIAPKLQGYDAERGIALYRRLQEAIAAVPGVRSVGLARHVPLEFSGNGGSLFVEGAPVDADRPAGDSAGWTMVTPGYFEAMGTALEAGRAFEWRDDAAAPGVVIVNRTLADRYWPGRSALGQKLRLESPTSPPLEVVGVVPDGKYRTLTESPRPYLFRPILQAYRGDATFVVRASGDAGSVAPGVREAVRSVDPELPLYDVKTLDQLVSGRALLLPRMAAQLAGVFAVAAVALAMVGLYGVVSFAVARREREIGIRMALGAPRPRILAMVMRDGAVLALAGVGFGLVAALAATRVLSGVLFGVGATDLATFAAVGASLLGAAAVAAFVPARRATAIDPMAALRSE